MQKKNRALIALLFLLLLPATSWAAEGYDNCTGFVDSLPAVISTQGTWCLRADQATSISAGAAITIATNNVTLDCNDFKVGGLAAGVGTEAEGIRADDRTNIVIRNCNVRGFARGVLLDGGIGGGHMVENNRFDGNRFVALSVVGDGSTVRGNRIFGTGESTVFEHTAAMSVGQSVDVLDNTISGVTGEAGSNDMAFGIYSDLNNAGSIRGNRISRIISIGTGKAYGIRNFGNTRTTIVGNHFRGEDVPGGVGVSCEIDETEAANPKAIARDNIFIGFETSRFGCADGGGNFAVSIAS